MFPLQKLVIGIADNESVYSMKGAINNLISLGLDGEHMCYLIARVRVLQSYRIYSEPNFELEYYPLAITFD